MEYRGKWFCGGHAIWRDSSPGAIPASPCSVQLQVYNQLHKFNQFYQPWVVLMKQRKKRENELPLLCRSTDVFSWFQLAINIYWETIIIGSHCNNSSFLSIDMQDPKPILLYMYQSLMPFAGCSFWDSPAHLIRCLLSSWKQVMNKICIKPQKKVSFGA